MRGTLLEARVGAVHAWPGASLAVTTASPTSIPPAGLAPEACGRGAIFRELGVYLKELKAGLYF